MIRNLLDLGAVLPGRWQHQIVSHWQHGFEKYTFYKRGSQCNTVLKYLVVKLSTSNSTFGSTNAFTGFTFATNFHIVLARTFPVCSSQFSCLSLCRRVNIMRSRLLENEAVYQLQHFPSTVTSPMSPVASHSLLTFICGLCSILFSLFVSMLSKSSFLVPAIHPSHLSKASLWTFKSQRIGKLTGCSPVLHISRYQTVMSLQTLLSLSF